VFDTLVEKGVNVEVLTPISGDTTFVVRELKHIFHVEDFKVNVPIMYVCVDSEICLLIKLSLTDFNLDVEGNLGILCSNPELCKLFCLFIMKSAS
jgi:hypothetical protein